MKSKGGRPPLKLPDLSYPDWLKAGCPPLELSVAQLAGWLDPPISRQRVNTFVNREELVRDADGKIRTDNPVNLAWIKDREGAEPPSYSPGRKGEGAVVDPTTRGYKDRERQPGERTPRQPNNPPSGEGLDLAAIDWDAILDAIENADLTVFKKADIDKIAKLETAAKTRVERMAKRGVLIDRRLVSTVFGKLYQVDTDQIKPLGAKLAADLGAAFGVEDSASLLLIEKTVDEETARILAHIKKLMNDFLAGVGEPSVDEDDDEVARILEDTANMLRGMTLDPAIPEHAKGAMRSRVRQLEGVNA